MCTGGLLIALGLSKSLIHHPNLSTLSIPGIGSCRCWGASKREGKGEGEGAGEVDHHNDDNDDDDDEDDNVVDERC